MDMDPNVFLHVALNEKGPSSCSPQQTDPNWHGILIRAPRQVRFKKNEVVGDTGAFAAVPICGYVCTPIRVDLPPEPLKLVAVDTKTKKVYSGSVFDIERGTEEPPPASAPLTEEEAEGMSVGEYFNPNLVDFVQLPRASATYEVHVEFRAFKSNAVLIELILEDS